MITLEHSYPLIGHKPTTTASTPLQRLIRLIDAETVTIKVNDRHRNKPSAYYVYFFGQELYQIRRLDCGWGWMSNRGRKYVYSCKQQAAQACVEWVLRRYWARVSPLFKGIGA